MSHVKHAAFVAVVALLAQVPAILASPAARSVIDHHPGLAVYVPVAVGVASALLRWLKPAASK